MTERVGLPRGRTGGRMMSSPAGTAQRLPMRTAPLTRPSPHRSRSSATDLPLAAAASVMLTSSGAVTWLAPFLATTARLPSTVR